MVGIKALFSFLGILLGLAVGLRWGMPRGWLVAIGTSAGGAIGGGIGGCVFGWLLESSSTLLFRLSDRMSSRNRVLGDLFRWSSFLLMIAIVCVGGYLLLRALPRHGR